jgi:transposase-like protein
MNKRKSYDSAFKLQAVLDSMRPDRTIEQVRVKHGVTASMINKWKAQFKKNAHIAFEVSTKKKKSGEQEDPEYLKRVIGDLTVQNDILKKALSVWD